MAWAGQTGEEGEVTSERAGAVNEHKAYVYEL